MGRIIGPEDIIARASCLCNDTFTRLALYVIPPVDSVSRYFRRCRIYILLTIVYIVRSCNSSTVGRLYMFSRFTTKKKHITYCIVAVLGSF